MRLPSCWVPVAPRKKRLTTRLMPLPMPLLLPSPLPTRRPMPLLPVLTPLLLTPLLLARALPMRALRPMPPLPRPRRKPLRRRSKRLLYGLNGRADGEVNPRLPPAVLFPGS